MNELMGSACRGAIGGLLATAPMTLCMQLMHRALPPEEKRPLPPREITAKTVQALDLGDELSGEAIEGLTWVNHFGFGAAAGALFGTLMPHSEDRSILSGMAYGLAVYAVSYMGWLPMAGLLPRATRQPAGQNAMLVAAHLVWGASLAASMDLLQDDPVRR